MSIECPRFGVSAIDVYSDGSYQPAESGKWAIVLGIEEEGELIDALAFYRSQPGKWWLRHGVARILGREALGEAWERGESVRLVATPAEWIAVSGAALCILDWSSDLFSTIGPVHGIVCDTPDLADRLRRACVRPRLRIDVRRAA